MTKNGAKTKRLAREAHERRVVQERKQVLGALRFHGPMTQGQLFAALHGRLSFELVGIHLADMCESGEVISGRAA